MRASLKDELESVIIAQYLAIKNLKLADKKLGLVIVGIKQHSFLIIIGDCSNLA